jgi:hypothetical protein
MGQALRVLSRLMAHKVLLGTLAIVVAAAVLVPLFTLRSSPLPSARVQRWRADITYLTSELPRLRIHGLGSVSRSTWDTAAASLAAQALRMSDGQLLVGMARMVALLHDDETQIDFPPAPFYALDAQWFGSGLYLIAVPATDRVLLGARVLAVDGHPVGQVIDRIGSVIDYQDPGILSTIQTGYLDDASLLYWLGITSSPASAAFTVRTTGGAQQTLSIVAGSSGLWATPDLMSELVPGEAHVPLPLRITG